MSLKSISIIAAAALALCAGAAQAVTQNGFANGGFELDGSGDTPAAPAMSWGQTDGGYQRSSAEANSGSWSMLLSVTSTLTGGGTPAQGFQNSIDNGGLAPLTVGDSPQFSFWAKGQTLFTGNATYFLQYLDDIGNIKYNNGPNGVTFHTLINPNTWTQIVVPGVEVPVGATAALVRFVSAAGPIIPGFDGNLTGNTVYVDDVYLGVAAIPEPSTYALMLAGLAGVGFLVRRRRQA